MKKLKKWIRELRHIVKNNNRQHLVVEARMDQLEGIIRERTDISADIHLKGQNPNQIIVVGRYRKADFVKVYTLEDNELHTLVEQLREMERYGVVSKLDAIPGLKAVVERDLY